MLSVTMKQQDTKASPLVATPDELCTLKSVQYNFLCPVLSVSENLMSKQLAP